jgi:RecA-family ATPase
VKGYIVEGATIIAGRPTIGKSWLALDWNVAVARGGFCFGEIHCKQGEVLYLALEDNKRRLKSRLAKLLGNDEWPSAFEYWKTCQSATMTSLSSSRESAHVTWNCLRLKAKHSCAAWI